MPHPADGHTPLQLGTRVTENIKIGVVGVFVVSVGIFRCEEEPLRTGGSDRTPRDSKYVSLTTRRRERDPGPQRETTDDPRKALVRTGTGVYYSSGLKSGSPTLDRRVSNLSKTFTQNNLGVSQRFVRLSNKIFSPYKFQT